MSEAEPVSVAHRRARLIQCAGGDFTVTVRPWTMAKRADWRPRVVALVQRVMAFTKPEGAESRSFVEWLLECEAEAALVAEASISSYSDGKSFGDLELADVWTVCQAIFELNFPQDGPVGKVTGLLRTIAEKALRDALRSPASSPPPSSKSSGNGSERTSRSNGATPPPDQSSPTP